MLDLGDSELKPHKISALLDNFFFHNFQGGTKGKMLKNCQNYTLVFEFFFLWYSLGNCGKKSWLKELKCCEVSENLAFAENFSSLSHWEVRNNAHPLYKLGRSSTSPFTTTGVVEKCCYGTRVWKKDLYQLSTPTKIFTLF